jgi:hypothetical protein
MLCLIGLWVVQELLDRNFNSKQFYKLKKADHLKEFTYRAGKINVLVIIFPCEAKHESVQGDSQVLHVICKLF